VGGYVNGLGLVRALAACNVPVAVITTKPYDIAHRSRWVAAHDAVREIDEQPERLVELLEYRAREWAGSAVFPTNDGALAALAQYHERLSSTYRLIAPPHEVARYFLDKELMAGVARAVGVDMPHSYGAAVEATAAQAEIQFPVVVKPNVGHRFFSRFECKLFAAHDDAELRWSIAQLMEAQMRGGVFDVIPGPDSQIYAYCTYIDAHGEPRGGLTVRKLRQSPPLYGVARVAEIADDHSALREATIEIVRRVNFRGLAIAEFKLDPRDGRFRFIEINGRSVVYNGLLRRAGLDLGRLAWSDYMGNTSERAHPYHWPGVWIHLHADILYSLLYRRHQRLGLREVIAPYRRPKTYAVWSASDPLPFVTQWSRTAQQGTAAVLRGTYPRLLADRNRPAPRTQSR